MAKPEESVRRRNATGKPVANFLCLLPSCFISFCVKILLLCRRTRSRVVCYHSSHKFCISSNLSKQPSKLKQTSNLGRRRCDSAKVRMIHSFAGSQALLEEVETSQRQVQKRLPSQTLPTWWSYRSNLSNKSIASAFAKCWFSWFTAQATNYKYNENRSINWIR